ncbi:NAD(P)-dependent oxidoreductase [Mangrovimicrobium sediminis]|uniref:NAD(P)-dependent oxidoreductase n=1 Tax=Mangrovimicrobium sediminis TaxID=2562682 RepID=A0A4Z0LZR5_9GAMM|nr:NAD(P)-binding oxidoreductase [Haliea sp. SAOS-164]TGD72647.1 NAD(P)-dependent oxidoreductase [Haliea sp. SAOS-164]
MSDPACVLVLGANGAVGRLVVEQVLASGARVLALVRDGSVLPVELCERDKLEILRGSILEMSDAQLAALLARCTAVVSCLGHNLSMRGIFGPPRRLVHDSLRRLCNTLESASLAEPLRLVLLSTVGYQNHVAGECVSRREAVLLWLLRHLVPPHADNEAAANYLRDEIGTQHPSIQWVAVRPDALLDGQPEVGVAAFPAPVRSALLDPGRTHRANVARFIAGLLDSEANWEEWRGRMPAIYDLDAVP